MKGWEQDSIADQLVREANDAIIMADQEGKIRLWNKGAKKIFGFSREEALSRPIHLNYQGLKKSLEITRNWGNIFGAAVISLTSIDASGD